LAAGLSSLAAARIASGRDEPRLQICLYIGLQNAGSQTVRAAAEAAKRAENRALGLVQVCGYLY